MVKVIKLIGQKRWVMIRQLYKKGLTISAIARQVGVDRKTARKYVSLLSYPKDGRKNKESKLDTYKAYLDAMLKDAPYTSTRLFREIRAQGFTGSYFLVQRYVKTVRNGLITKAVYRFETKPGQQSQVDWGDCGRIKQSGKELKLYCFSMILGYSRMRYVEFTTSCNTETLIKCHINAFNYFGGYSREILYDNLKQVIIKRLYNVKESKLNTKFADFCGYYGFTPRFCRPYRAQTKGKIENTIRYVKSDFFMGIKAASLEQLNNEARTWLERVNSQVHGTTREVPYERLKQENLQSIHDVPPYDTSKVLMRKVSRECYVHYQGNRYSVPYKYAGYNVEVKADDTTLTIYYGKTRICSHDLLTGVYKVSKDKEHFKGLLKQIQEENKRPYRKNWVLDCDTAIAQVEERSLTVYDKIGGTHNE
jgi:transposase